MHQLTVCNSHPHFYDLRECLFCRWKIRTSCNTSVLYSLSWQCVRPRLSVCFGGCEVRRPLRLGSNLAPWSLLIRVGEETCCVTELQPKKRKFCNPVWKRKGSRFNWSWLCMRYSVVTGACSSTRAARSAHAAQRLFCCLSLHMAPICCLIRVGASLTPVNEMPKEASVRPLTSLSLVCLDHRDTSVWSRQ